MQGLIEGLLKYSRIRAPELSAVDTSTICASAMANLSAAITESGAKLSVKALPVVRGDAIMLMQLFQNLLSNAIKYRKPNVAPLITVTADKKAHEWLFSISDNGIGIPPEHYNDVFEIFRRLHTREEYPGTGIGLASCKKIVEQHGGRIWLESSPGVGTTFFFTLPSGEASFG
jgi:light-regulated signal transduction histidine kinase (bacteriophytochrome)